MRSDTGGQHWKMGPKPLGLSKLKIHEECVLRLFHDSETQGHVVLDIVSN